MPCSATTASPPESAAIPPPAARALPLLLLGAVLAAPADGETLLPAEDRQAIEAALGGGIFDTTLPPSPIADPAEFLPHGAAAGRFRILRGEGAGGLETHRAQVLGPEAWNYQLSRDETGFLRLLKDHSLVMAGIEDRHSNALTRYEPAEPFLPAGLQAGGETRLHMAVRVYDRTEPDDVRHRGSLHVSLRHLGDYRVRVPDGQFDAILLKASFQGAIGPASVTDTQYRFLAKGVGLVAMTEQREVSAFFVYRDRVDVAKVLAGLPP